VSQTSIVFAALLLAFLVYITLRGDLKTWLGLLGV
jgi:hypothetical protein